MLFTCTYCTYCWKLCSAPDECVLFHTILISLFHLLSQHCDPSFFLSPTFTQLPPSLPHFLSALLTLHCKSSLSLPCPSCSLLCCCYRLTYFALRQSSFSPVPYQQLSPSFSLYLSSPTFYTSPSITDGKQVLFSQFISSFPPCCLVALVSNWQERRGIWVSVGVGEKWE